MIGGDSDIHTDGCCETDVCVETEASMNTGDPGLKDGCVVIVLN